MTNEYEYDFLSHHGIKSQKWGRRQYQNHDGSLTTLGRIHYGVGEARKGASKVAEFLRTLNLYDDTSPSILVTVIGT